MNDESNSNRVPARRWSLLIIFTTVAVITAALGLVAASPAPARVAGKSHCCLRVTIDADGGFIVDYGPQSNDPHQRDAGQEEVRWGYHIRALASYSEGVGGSPYIDFLLQRGSKPSHYAAVYWAALDEENQVQERSPSGWYPQLPTGRCSGGKNAEIYFPYTPWPDDRGGFLPGLLLPVNLIPNCDPAGKANDGLFGGVFGGYTDIKFPFPTAHRADLRRGTMHASTICQAWKDKSRTGTHDLGDYGFTGFMNETISLDSFSVSALPAAMKAVKRLAGGDGTGFGRNYDQDPFQLGRDANGTPTFKSAPKGSPGCHKP